VAEARTRTADTTIFSRAVPASESNLLPGNFLAFRNVCGVRVFPDFASVCRALRQTAVPVCLLLRSVTTGALWCHRAASQAAYRDAERATASTGDPEIAARTNAEPDDVSANRTCDRK